MTSTEPLPEPVAEAIRKAGGVTFADVDWDLVRPCQDCPFRKSTPWHEGVAANAVKCVESIEENRFAHTCHKTDRRADSEHGKAWEGRVKHCAGALYMLIKTGNGADLQLPLLLAAEAGKVDLEDLDRRARADTECFTVAEFLAFQAKGAAGHWGDEVGRQETERSPS